jgi:hypothetical protein
VPGASRSSFQTRASENLKDARLHGGIGVFFKDVYVDYELLLYCGVIIMSCVVDRPIPTV